MTIPASRAVRVTTVTAVVVVAVVAAVVSYSHMTELAHRAGEQWRSWLIPISVDGLIVAASMVLLTRHRAGQPGGPLAWGSLGVGVLASLAANMADARPEVTSVLVAGWAPVAFAAAFHLLLQQRRAENATPTIPDPDRPERSSERSVRPESALTVNAPLRHSGNPAGQGDTVLPGTGGLSSSSSPSVPGPIDVEPVHPLSPGSGVDRRSADRVVVAGPLPAPVRSEVPVRPTGAGQPVATKPATTQTPRRDRTATLGATRSATQVRQTKPSTAEQRRAWVRQQRDNGRSVTGSDVHKQFPDAPRDGARILRQVDAELEAELRAVAAGER